ncbi:thioredoxin family protein [Psychrobacillus vulpis]|uniref:Thioredoxin family protein n=1 Tax=Psychrobacillus vulpis TaxID=2325572 RepID=A0A544TPT9_9BACI|nr:thioredoxin family protein [Psychrobacillus vulpis]TQR19471.1 thioredoxin family protein [Psychrobacillus vulpis]
MIKITNYADWLQVSEKEQSLLLFVKTTNCSVCEGLYPKMQELQVETSIPFYMVNASDVKEMAGQLSLFTAPVVLFWRNNKEYARFARFISLGDIRNVLKELDDMGNSHV